MTICKYQNLCKYYDNCKPTQYVEGGLNISDCWRKNTLDGLVKTEWGEKIENKQEETSLVDNKRFKSLRIYLNKDLELG